MNTNQKSAQEKRLQAVKIAETVERCQVEDRKDMENCIADLQKIAGLDAESARIVAAAYRSKVLPNVARGEGLDDKRIAQLMGVETADFANDKPLNKKPMAPHHSDPMSPEMGGDEMGEEDQFGHGDGMDESESHIHEVNPVQAPIEHADDELALPMGDEVSDDDLSEADNDNDNTVIQIEIPADKLEAVQKAIESVLGGGPDFQDDSEGDFGGEEESGDQGFPFDSESDTDTDPHADLGSEGDMDADPAQDDFPNHAAEPKKAVPHFASNKVTNMDKNAAELAKRAAARKQILASRTAVAEEGEGKPKDIGLGTDTSHGGKPFQHASEAQYEGEDKYPTMNLEGSDGNSLREQNPTYTKQMIPTMNGDNLQLKDSYEVGKKEGSPDGSLEYTVDFAKLNNIPSADPDRSKTFEVPTQMTDLVKRNRNVAIAKVVECQGCDNPRTAEVHVCDCTDCGTRIAICLECQDDEYCPKCAAISQSKSLNRQAELTIEPRSEEDADMSEVDPGMQIQHQVNGDGFTRKPHKDDTSDRKSMELMEARLATAYDLAYHLALAGAIQRDEVKGQVEMWMRDGVSPRSMQAQANAMLRCAMNAAERVASAAADKLSVRQASTPVGVSTSPAIYTGGFDRSAPQDLREALSTLWVIETPEKDSK